MGFNYLISPGLGEHMRCLDDPSVPLAARLRCVQACESLFRKLLLPCCSLHLSHLDEPGRSPLNTVCYMCWDIMPVYGGPRLEDRHALHRASGACVARDDAPPALRRAGRVGASGSAKRRLSL